MIVLKFERIEILYIISIFILNQIGMKIIIELMQMIKTRERLMSFFYKKYYLSFFFIKKYYFWQKKMQKCTLWWFYNR